METSKETHVYGAAIEGRRCDTKEEALEVLRYGVSEARGQIGDEVPLICVTQELLFGGYGNGVAAMESACWEEIGKDVVALSEEYPRTLIVVSCPQRTERDGGEGEMSIVQVGVLDGEVVGLYAKTHLFSEYETEMFVPGSELVVFPAFGRRVGCAICMDLEYPEVLRSLAVMGADVVVVSTALGEGPISVLASCLLRTRANENHIHVIYANGHEPDSFVGGSCIVDPDGVVIALSADHSATDKPSVVLAPIPITDVHRANVERNPYLSHRRPHLYSSLVASSPS